MTDTQNGLPSPYQHSELYADVPFKRFAAFVIDSILIFLITIMLIPLTAFTALFYFGFLGLVVSLIYRIVSLANKSSTPGMRLMAIEFRTHQGERFDLGTAVVHTLLFTVFMSMILPQLVSIILILTSGRAQGLHDFILGTAANNRTARQ